MDAAASVFVQRLLSLDPVEQAAAWYIVLAIYSARFVSVDMRAVTGEGDQISQRNRSFTLAAR